MGHEAHYTPDGKIYLRKSMIEDFAWCPWRYNLVWNENIVKRPTQAMLAGTRFHEFAEKFFDYCGAISMDRWDEFIPEQFKSVEVKMASWFIEYERKRYHKLEMQDRLDEFRPIIREHRMISHKMVMESTVDRVDWWDKQKGEVCLVEYKTGSKVNDESLIRQLSFYMILWQETMNVGNVTHFKLINPRVGVEKIYPVKMWYIDKVIREISKIRKAIAEGNYPRTCNDVKYAFCRQCSLEDAGLLDDSEFESNPEVGKWFDEL